MKAKEQLSYFKVYSSSSWMHILKKNKNYFFFLHDTKPGCFHCIMQMEWQVVI